MEAGYDKIKIWIDRTIVGDQYPTIANYLDSAKQETDLQTGEVKTYGCIEGLKVSVYTGGLSVIGSYPKFLFGSNVYPLNRHTTAQALEKLADTLHLRVSEADVTEIEFGANYLMKHPVVEYLSKLGTMPRLDRLQVATNSLRYGGKGKQQRKVYAFYDKKVEATTKGIAFPEDLKGANMLRYEMRLNGRLPQQLRVAEVTASTLTQAPFYKMMVKRYQDSYFSISKQNNIKINIMSEIKTVSDAFNVFVARLISQSDQTQISGFLDELKEAGVFEDRKNYSRLKKKIQEIATKANITVTDELMRELDDEIKNCGAYV